MVCRLLAWSRDYITETADQNSEERKEERTLANLVPFGKQRPSLRALNILFVFIWVKVVGVSGGREGVLMNQVRGIGRKWRRKSYTGLGGHEWT